MLAWCLHRPMQGFSAALHVTDKADEVTTMANRSFTRSFYTLEEYPVIISCNFIVDSTNGNGLGLRSLKGPGVKAVYMHTSATPASGSPNPASGTIVVQLQDNYNRLLSGFDARVSALSGTPVAILASGAALVVGNPYVITSIGTSTAADFHAIGVPKGVTPAVGVAFIASATGSGVGSGSVQAPAATGSGVASIETVGDSNLAIAPLKLLNQGFGAQIILQCRDYAGAIVAPAAGSVISLALYLSNGSNTVSGE
jgi:hypothetical protein